VQDNIYLNPNELKVGMLVRVEHKVMMILPDLKGACKDGFVLVEDIRTGKRHQQNAYYLRPLKT
jgi:hypothetical protein